MASPGGQEPQPDSNSKPGTPGTPVAEPEVVDKELEELWGQLKATVKKDLTPEDAQLLDSISVKDLSEDRLLEKLARDQLGPILSQAGINMDPFVFVGETLKLVLFLQFVSCGLTFYGTENLAHFPVGSAFIAAAGLAMGYLTRPTLQIDYLLAPVYNTFINLFIPNATYEVGKPTQAALQGLFNKLGVIVALAFFLPRWLWGWTTDDCVHFVVPLASGWFLFDIWFMLAVTLVLRNNDEI